jgi:ATP-dependent RNA helicase DeaD
VTTADQDSQDKTAENNTENNTENEQEFADEFVDEETQVDQDERVDESVDEELAAEPEATWDDIELAPSIRAALDEMEYPFPTEVQAKAIPLALEGKDLVVQSRTGTGKTAAFGVPILQRLINTEINDVQALILAPTRELAIQVANEITRIAADSLRVLSIYGGAAMGPQIDALEKGVHVVAGTPGRVLDHIRRKNLRTAAITTLVLDEGDEMLSMGFQEEIANIIDRLPEERHTMLFSATVPDEIKRLIAKYLNEPERLLLSEDFIGVREIDHVYYLVSGGDRPADLMRVLEFESPEVALIFCNTRDDTAMVAQFLRGQGIPAEGISSDLSQHDRERVMGRMRKGELKYLVATDVAARGIDLSDLSHVINYAFPESADVYVHRTGRTGRAGKHGTAVSLVSPREIGSFYYLKLIHKIYPEERHLPSSDELATRREAARYERLMELFKEKDASEELRGLTRRIWNTIDGERLLSLALGVVLEERDELFAVLPPAPKPVAAETSQPRRDDRPDRRDDRGGRDRDRDRGRGSGRDRDGGRDRGRSRGRDSGRDRDRGRGRGRDGGHDRDRGRGRDRDGGPDRDRGERKTTRTRRPQDNDQLPEEQGSFTTPDGDIEYWETVDAPARSGESRDHGGSRDHEVGPDQVRIFINIGRRQGIQGSDLSQYLQDEAEIDGDAVGRIQMRDNFSFINVASAAADNVIEKLTGKSYKDREIRVERAKRP